MQETAPARVSWNWLDLLLTIGMTLGGGLLLAFVGIMISDIFNFSSEGGLGAPAAFIAGASVYLASIVGVYLFAVRRSSWAALGLGPVSMREMLLVIPVFITGMILLVLVNNLIGFLLGGFENPQVDSITGGIALSGTQLFLVFVLVVILAPFAEELLFRGMLYPLLRERIGVVGAIVVSAAMFSAIHVIPILLPGLFVIGLLLGYLRERSGSIWPCIFYHVLQNGLALFAINFALSNPDLLQP